MRLPFIIMMLLVLASCGADTSSQQEQDAAAQQAANANTDTSQVISMPCVVLIQPTDEKVAALRKEVGEQDFNTIADDKAYYYSNASVFLDSMKRNVFQRTSSGTLIFQQQNGQETSVDLDKYDWAVILFDGKRPPVATDVLEFEETYARYYGRNDTARR